MKRSTDRVPNTDTGSMMGSPPRPDVLADLPVARAEGKPVDAAPIPALAADVVPARLAAMCDGAAIAGKRLWN